MLALSPYPIGGALAIKACVIFVSVSSLSEQQSDVSELV